MPEPVAAIGAIVAGASCGVAVFTIARGRDGMDAAAWLARRHAARWASDAAHQARWSKAQPIVAARELLLSWLERAGWKESPERVVVFALALAGSTAVMAAALASMVPMGNSAVLGAVGFAGGIGSCVLVLRSAVTARRRRLAAELTPLLELFTLELSGGGSAFAALGSVTSRIQGELASDLRNLLIAAQVAGSVPFESRLISYSEHLEIPALASFATILGSSREYGTGVGPGVRALSTDLRHAQRRELIAHSRRALNQVLIPAAVGVLLPFLAVVMFPAVTALQRNLY